MYRPVIALIFPFNYQHDHHTHHHDHHYHLHDHHHLQWSSPITIFNGHPYHLDDHHQYQWLCRTRSSILVPPGAMSQSRIACSLLGWISILSLISSSSPSSSSSSSLAISACPISSSKSVCSVAHRLVLSPSPLLLQLISIITNVTDHTRHLHYCYVDHMQLLILWWIFRNDHESFPDSEMLPFFIGRKWLKSSIFNLGGLWFLAFYLRF